MIAGHGTHADQLAREARRYTICDDESFNAVQRPPNESERAVVDVYEARYAVTFGVKPAGLHYLQLGPDLTAVYFPLPE